MGSCVVAMHAKYIEYSMCNHLNLKRDRERHIQYINSTLIPREREKREREREKRERERGGKRFPAREGGATFTR